MSKDTFKNNIGIKEYEEIYTKAFYKVNEVQPKFILYRDTIRTFLHEKKALLGLLPRALAFLGIEIGLIAALFTATFKDFRWIKGNTIRGTFIAFSIIFGGCFLYFGIYWLICKKKLDVDCLAEDLGERGVVIDPTKKNDETNK